MIRSTRSARGFLTARSYRKKWNQSQQDQIQMVTSRGKMGLIWILVDSRQFERGANGGRSACDSFGWLGWNGVDLNIPANERGDKIGAWHVAKNWGTQSKSYRIRSAEMASTKRFTKKRSLDDQMGMEQFSLTYCCDLTSENLEYCR